jgi:hypothetical protein
LTRIKRDLLGDKKTEFKEKVDSGLFWKDEKMRLLKYALDLRFQKDNDFQTILNAAKAQKKYLMLK